MAAPPTPHDPEVRAKIDKIAVFVAKAGPQAEERLRADHNGKPQFTFLFGGEHSDYYRFALRCEIYNLNEGLPQFSRPGAQQSQPQSHSVQESSNSYQGHDQGQGGPSPQANASPTPSFDFAVAQARIDQLNQEITNSESNLEAHHDALPMQKDAEFATACLDAENAKTKAYLEKVNLDVSGLDLLLEQLHGKCSKDVVSNMKRWIFDNCTTDQLREVILAYLLSRVRCGDVTEQFRLHVLYLINDWAHYCQRKKQDGVRQMLSRYVPQLYAFAAESVQDPTTTHKLDKLLGVWEGSKYFDDNCFKQLRNPSIIIVNYRNQVHAEHQKLGAEILARLQSTYSGYEQQHNEFATHMRNQITAIEAQIEMEKAKAEELHRKSIPSLLGGGARRSRFDCGPAAGDYGGFFNAPPAAAAPPVQMAEQGRGREDWRSASTATSMHSEHDENIDGEPIDSSAIPCPPDIDESSLVPRVPFYDLPAGIMMGQINIEDLTYKPITVSNLRLPPPIPPTRRLLMAIDAFYAPPTADTPRDPFGWEKNGLAEFFERKSRLKKVLEDTQCVNGTTFDDLILNRPSSADLEEERLDRERARQRGEMEALRRRRSGSIRSRSRSSSRGRKSRSSSRSSRSNSRSPRRRKSRSTSSSPRRKRSLSRSASPEARVGFGARARSPSPPARFANPNVYMPPQPLGAENKGAQLMAKMGWTGRGLGANEHGIQEPISGGEVRTNDEKYMGLGHKSEQDEFAEFRKQRSSAYTQRHGGRGRRLDD